MNYLKSFIFYLCLFPVMTFASPYYFNMQQEIGFVGFGAGLEVLGLYAETKKIEPTQTDINLLSKDDISKIDRFAAGRWSQSAATRSDVVLYSALTVPMLLPVMHRSSFWDISLMYFETVLITNGGVNVAKGFSHRYRPYAYGSDVSNDRLYDIDTKRSFFSGHAAHISSSMIFLSKVYSDLHPESPYKKSVWLTSGLIILYGSWQRVEAGMHFTSDIMTGMLWGGIVGYGVPEWHLKKHKIQFLPFSNERGQGMRFFSEFY